MIWLVIIYHDFLPPPRRGNHVKSDNTHNHQHTSLSSYTRHLRPFSSFSQPHHVTASHPSPGNNHQSTGGRSERTHCQAELHALHLHPSSTPFWPYGTRPFFKHAQTISILSDLLYSLTPLYVSKIKCDDIIRICCDNQFTISLQSVHRFISFVCIRK